MAANSSNVSEMDVDCLLYPDKPVYCHVLVTCKRVSASLSIFGTVLVLMIIVLYKRYRFFSQRLIAHLCVASMLLSVTFLLADVNHQASPLCVAQGALMMFSVVCVCLWVMVVMANLYHVTFYDDSLQRYEKPLTLFCWIVPVVFMVVPFCGSHVYGPAGVWCWIINDWRWRFGLWYIIRILSVLMFFVVSVRIVYHVVKMARINSQTVTEFYASHDEVRTLRMYPIVYFLIHLFPIINRIQNAVSGTNETNEYVFGLLLLQTLAEPFVGAALALAFMINKTTLQLLSREKLKETIQMHWTSSSDILEYKVFD